LFTVEMFVTTAVFQNSAKKKLNAGELVLCMAVNQMRSAEVPMIAARCGFDAIFIAIRGLKVWRRGGGVT
jgi:hypothetical protein